MIEIIRTIHISCAVISIFGFFVRGVGVFSGAKWIQMRITKVLPHLIDTLLLVSAFWLLYLYGFSFAKQPWLIAKIIALLLYIVAGSVALKRGKTLPIKLTAFMIAILAAGYIVTAATSKSAWAYLSYI